MPGVPEEREERLSEAEAKLTVSFERARAMIEMQERLAIEMHERLRHEHERIAAELATHVQEQHEAFARRLLMSRAARDLLFDDLLTQHALLVLVGAGLVIQFVLAAMDNRIAAVLILFGLAVLSGLSSVFFSFRRSFRQSS